MGVRYRGCTKALPVQRRTLDRCRQSLDGALLGMQILGEAMSEKVLDRKGRTRR